MKTLIDLLMYLLVAAVLAFVYLLSKVCGWLPWDDAEEQQ